MQKLSPTRKLELATVAAVVAMLACGAAVANTSGAGHGGLGGGGVGSGEFSGGGHGGFADVGRGGGFSYGGRGYGGGWGGEWQGRGFYGFGYSCCAWGIGIVDPFWDPYLWLDYTFGVPYLDPYGYGAMPEAAPAPSTSTEPAPSYWYYCPDTKAYYPYVRQCALPWQRVVPSALH